MIYHKTLGTRHLQHHNYIHYKIKSYRKISLTEQISTSHGYPQSPLTHIIAQQPNVEKTYKQTIEQPHTKISVLRTTTF